jgi:hypothetical protein
VPRSTIKNTRCPESAKALCCAKAAAARGLPDVQPRPTSAAYDRALPRRETLDYFRGITPDALITTWKPSTCNEAAASKAHFPDLCALLQVPPPHSDPTGATYTFEKWVRKAAGGGGWADVWRRGCFGWEYKFCGGDLEKAHDKLLRYAEALENPPLLITSDMDRIIVRTNWTNAVSERREFGVEDMRNPTARAMLKAYWTDPARWRSAVTRQALTEKLLALNLGRPAA